MKPFVDLSKLINPTSVVVVGASPRPASQGARLYENMTRHSAFSGRVYAVNPAYSAIGEAQCWPSILDLPKGDIDVALIIVNANLVLETLEQCVERNIPFAIVMSSGFSETGEKGSAMEKAIADLCARTGLHVYGPNCPGFVNVRDRIGMTFSPAFKDDLNAGSIGLATQGGGLGRNLLQGLSFGEGVGLWFSAGNEVDLEIPDFIVSMANDPRIRVIGLLMEGVKDGRRLTAALDLARQRNKPVVILKIGHSEAGALAAQSHTASIAGSASVNSAVFRQFGAIEVTDLDQLIAVTHLLSPKKPIAGGKLCIYTFSGGTAALATDIAGTIGLPMASFTEATNARLRSLLPDFASISNPVDTTADILRNQDAANECLRVVCEDPNVGVVLFPIPMDYGDVTDSIAQSIIDVSRSTQTPIVPVWMSRRMGGGFQKLEENGLQPFLSLSSAIDALAKVWPVLTACERPLAIRKAVTATVSGQVTGTPAIHYQLSEVEAKAILRRGGMTVPESEVAKTARHAAEISARMNVPLALKIVSPDIAHKTEYGGVELNIESAQAASDAFERIQSRVRTAAPHARLEGVLLEAMAPRGGQEVLIGVHRDDAFGLVLTFGLGGIFVETLRDAAHRMVPLTPQDARSMIREIRNIEILDGVRGQDPSDLPALERLLLQVSSFASRHADTLLEMELNPVWVGPIGQGAIPLDALIVATSPLHQPAMQDKSAT